jgi:hypothetical protein
LGFEIEKMFDLFIHIKLFLLPALIGFWLSRF